MTTDFDGGDGAVGTSGGRRQRIARESAIKRVLPFLVVLGLLAAAAPARADEAQPVEVEGHFPWGRLDAVGGVGIVPIPHPGRSGPPDTHKDVTGVLGPRIDLHLDTGPVLLNLEGLFNFVSPTGLLWMARGEIVVGKRSMRHVLKSISRSPRDAYGYVTTTTEIYKYLYLPMFTGLSVGASVWHFGSVTHTQASYEGPDTRSRPGAILPMVDLGFTIQSPQLELTIGPVAELSTTSFGLRWVFGMGFPVGDYPFFFRLSGDHIFGDDRLDGSGRRMTTTLLCALGMGTDLGLGL